MTRIGFVGAGSATAAAAFALDEATGADAATDVTVLEKSRSVCGRAATRRRDGIRYDYGANYVKADDPRVVELLTETLDADGLVDVTEPIYTFDADGRVSEGRDADEHKWSYEEGLTGIAKRLFGRSDATVHRETRVERVARTHGAWPTPIGPTTRAGGTRSPRPVLHGSPCARPRTAACTVWATGSRAKRACTRPCATGWKPANAWPAGPSER